MEFAQWLQNQLNKQGWSQSELVRRSNHQVSQTQLSNVLLGRRQAGPETCIAIARALGLSNEEVFRARGWLPASKSDIDPRAERVARRVSALPAQSREIALDAIEPMLESVYKLTQIREAAEYDTS
jgi:transcriptional regulator with XRE-family HTH domain